MEMLEKVAVYPLQKKRLPKVSNFLENFPKSQFSSPFSHRQTTMMGTMRNSKIGWQEKRAWSLASGSLRSGFQEVNRQVAVACCGPLRIPQENVGRKLRTLPAVRWLEDSVLDVYNC